MKSSWTVGQVACVAVIFAVQAVAQDGDRPPMAQGGHEGPRMRQGPRGGMFEGREGRPGGPGMPGVGGGEEAMLARILAVPKVAETLGLSADQIKTLQDGLTSNRKEIATLQVDLENASMEQARLLTSNQNVDESAVMATVDKAGEIRTKIAKLMIKQLLIVKKTLTPEQIEKARAMIRERVEKNRDRIGADGEQDGDAGPGNGKHKRDRGARWAEKNHQSSGEKATPPAEKDN